MSVRRFSICAGLSTWASIAVVLLFVATPSDAQRGEGDLCHSKYGGSGVCLDINSCPSAIRMVREGIMPEKCGYRGSTVIVCCEDAAASSQLISGDSPPRKPQGQPPTTQFGSSFNQPIRRSISEEKCDEYAWSVAERVEALPLLPNPDPITITVKKCDIEKLPLIVGGEKTRLGEFPHMAAIGYQDDGGLAWLCAGSLISEYYVLTAAHCTNSSLGPPVIVRLGELNLKRDDDGAHPVDYRIVDIVRHPEYKPPSKYNDIALLRLSGRVHFNKFLRPACLYTHDSFSVNKTVATGWGNIANAGKPSETLLKVVLDIIDNKLCNNLWQSGGNTSSLPYGIASSMMCAGVLAGGKDTCQGDSGGPIQISSRRYNCVYYVVGVTSFGRYCAYRNSPGVYTRVSYFIPWIESIVWPDG